MQTPKISILATALLAVVVTARADYTPASGEWETTLRMTIKGAPRISPEQVAQMKTLGINIPFVSGEPVMTKQCITPEQAASDKPFNVDPKRNGGCTVQNYKRSGNKATGDMVCKGGQLEGNGQFEMTLDSETTYHGSWNIRSVVAYLGPMEQLAQLNGKWLKAKCDVGAH